MVPPAAFPAPESALLRMFSPPPAIVPRVVESSQNITNVVSAQLVRPCQAAVPSLGLPESRPAVIPPKNDAIIPDTTHHTAAPIEKDDTEGLLTVEVT